jgi:hypothetical protein
MPVASSSRVPGSGVAAGVELAGRIGGTAVVATALVVAAAAWFTPVIARAGAFTTCTLPEFPRCWVAFCGVPARDALTPVEPPPYIDAPPPNRLEPKKNDE